jgi:hypothetical protein
MLRFLHTVTRPQKLKPYHYLAGDWCIPNSLSRNGFIQRPQKVTLLQDVFERKSGAFVCHGPFVLTG